MSATGPLICALFAVAVGAAVLAGWLFDVPLLKSVLPGFIAMKPNTAFAFVLAGGSLLLLLASPLPRARARTGQALALIVVLIGALTLGEYVFGWQLGIDELLFKDRDTTEAWKLVAGRMAASTAAAFLLLGLALLAFEWEPRRGLRTAELLALLVFVLSLIAAIEYAFGHAIAYPFFQHTRMALHTFVTFIVLSAGVVAARPAQGILGAIRAQVVSPLERRVYGALALGALALLVTGAAGYFSARDSITRTAAEDNAQEVRLQLLQLLSSHQELQTGQRGYAVTGDEAFLQPYQRALPLTEADRNYGRLAALLQADPPYVARLVSLKALHDQRIEFSKQVVNIRRSDGAEALDYLFGTEAYAGRDLSEPPQMVLLDLKLPIVSGLEVLKRIREEERTRFQPVVIPTSFWEEHVLVSSYGLGANSYIRKPAAFDQFSDAVRQVGLYWLMLNEAPLQH